MVSIETLGEYFTGVFIGLIALVILAGIYFFGYIIYTMITDEDWPHN